jgi:hypothetical protein
MAQMMTMLEELQWHWGSAYMITGAAGHWIAQRRDDGRTLLARGPEGLRELMIEDYGARPVPRDAAPGAES